MPYSSSVSGAAGRYGDTYGTTSTAKLYCDGERKSVSAYTINDYTHYKLRDLAKLLDMGVTWEEGSATTASTPQKAISKPVTGRKEKEMSLFKKLQEKRTAERVRKSERMQGFTMQAELSATIVSVRLLDGAEAETRFLVEYANGEKKEEAVKNDSERFQELSMYLG